MAKTIEKKSNKKLDNTKIHNKKKEKTLFLHKFKLVILALLGLIVFYPPFLRGLYFENEQLPTEIFVFIVYIAFLIYKYLKQEKKFIKTPLEYVAVGFVVVYFLSILNAAGTREAIGEWLKYCMFFAVFIMLSELLNTYRSKLYTLWVLIGSAIGISIIGIDGTAGGIITAKLNQVFKTLGADNNVFYGIFVGNRINSTFQYPNATAAYLMAIFFIAITLMMLSKRIYVKLIAGIASYIIITTFVLTLSRGAIVFLPIAGAIFIVTQIKGNIIKSIINLIPAGTGLLFTAAKLTNFMASPKGNEANIWKTLFFGIIVTLISQLAFELLSILIAKIAKINTNMYKRVKVIGGAFCGVVFVLFIIGSIFVITSKESLTLFHSVGQGDSDVNVRRSFILEPEKEYKLVYKVQSENAEEKPNTYTLAVASRDFSGIINGVDTPLLKIEGKATNGIEDKEEKFKVPANSRAVSITFSNYYEGTKVEFKEAWIEPVGHNDKVQYINLKYKYIPESIYKRIDEAKETKSGIERTIFAKDGLEIFKDNPVLGGGGGSWPLQYFAHQSYLYWSTQAHNYPIQVAVETGLLGIIVLIALWITVIIQIVTLIKSRNTVDKERGIINAGVLAGAIALIMHSTMDFDLSLSAIYLLLWELLAILNSDILYSKEYTVNSNKIFNKLAFEIKTIYVKPIIISIVVGIIIIFPTMFVSGIKNSDKAVEMQKRKNFTSATEYFAKAISSDPISPKYKGEYINMVILQDVKKLTKSDILKTDRYAKSIEKDGEKNVEIALKLASYYIGSGNIEKGRYFLDKATELRPLNPNEWEQKVNAFYQIAMFYKNNKDDKSAEKYLNGILQIPEDIRNVSQKSMIPFTMTPTTMEVIEKVKIYQEKKNTSNESISSKTVFYALNDIDIDGNGVPDEWNATKNLKLQVDANKLTVESDAGKQGILESRKINLKPEKTYVFSVDIENASDITGDVMVNLSGQNEPIKLTRLGSIYVAQISTASGEAIEPISLGLVVNGKYVIKDVRLVEK